MQEKKEICGLYQSANPSDDRQGCCGVCVHFNFSIRQCDQKESVRAWTFNIKKEEMIV